MDTSIRLYNSNSRLPSILDAKKGDHPTAPLLDEQDCRSEATLVDEEERATDTISRQSAGVLDALQEQAQRVDVADFETIFLRFQGPITNFIYHMEQESFPTQEALPLMALAQTMITAQGMDVAVQLAHSMNVEATMVVVSKIALPIVKSLNASLESCHPSMPSVSGYTKMMASLALKLLKR